MRYMPQGSTPAAAFWSQLIASGYRPSAQQIRASYVNANNAAGMSGGQWSQRLTEMAKQRQLEQRRLQQSKELMQQIAQQENARIAQAMNSATRSHYYNTLAAAPPGRSLAFPRWPEMPDLPGVVATKSYGGVNWYHPGFGQYPPTSWITQD